MQIDWIETFLDLSETASFNRTAEQLGVSQSTVSARISGLEAALGAPLFERSRAGTRLSAAGLRFLPHARALRHEWTEARRALEAGASGRHLRIGLQSDLASGHLGAWVQGVLEALPGLELYIEADFSRQMCADVLAGAQDLAILYTPQPHPDLHFEPLGVVQYRMVSTHAERLAGVARENVILANYAPAFAAAQREVLAALPGGTEGTGAPVSSGLDSAVRALVLALGGTAYVLESTARELVAAQRAHWVGDAPPIAQPVHAALHLRRRHVGLNRRLVAIMRAHFPTPV